MVRPRTARKLLVATMISTPLLSSSPSSVSRSTRGRRSGLAWKYPAMYRWTILACSRSQARHRMLARSPGRRWRRYSTRAATVAIAEAMLSFPARRPALIHNSRTRWAGGSRPATLRKNARSDSLSCSACAPLSTARHGSHDFPRKKSPSRFGSSMAAAGVIMRRQPLFGPGTRRATKPATKQPCRSRDPVGPNGSNCEAHARPARRGR